MTRAVTQILQQESCDSNPVTQILWHESHSTSSVTRFLWHDFCDTSPVTRVLWHESCDTSPVALVLQHKSCNTSPVLRVPIVWIVKLNFIRLPPRLAFLNANSRGIMRIVTTGTNHLYIIYVHLRGTMCIVTTGTNLHFEFWNLGSCALWPQVQTTYI